MEECLKHPMLRNKHDQIHVPLLPEHSLTGFCDQQQVPNIYDIIRLTISPSYDGFQETSGVVTALIP